MTKQEFMRRQHLENALTGLGFTSEEVEKLRRISNTLRRWFDLECGTDAGAIERDENGKPWLVSGTGRRWPTADRETGARKRLSAIIAAHNARTESPVSAYIQTDPRGAALYILRPGDVLEGMNAESCYSRGICVY
jgi:hypothetical protein